jgi:hypothetical protein
MEQERLLETVAWDLRGGNITYGDDNGSGSDKGRRMKKDGTIQFNNEILQKAGIN